MSVHANYQSEYEEEFGAAIQYAASLGEPASFALMPTFRPMPHAVREELRKALDEKFGEDGAFQCLAAAEFACEFVRMAGGHGCLTIGYLLEPSGPLWFMTREDIQEWMHTPPDPCSVSIHAWVTLPNLEILDPTVLRSMKSQRKTLISHPAEPSTSLRHRPVVAGDAIARRLFGLHRRT